MTIYRIIGNVAVCSTFLGRSKSNKKIMGRNKEPLKSSGLTCIKMLQEKLKRKKMKLDL